ncbi:MAG: diaminopimelate epimerase [Ignavibacteria bacterium]|nr:diaminopimelate epimerase [Ignavibacteria bacterium]
MEVIQKYSGAGNKFIILNNLDESYTDRRSKVLELMNEDGNDEMDGVIFIEKSSIGDFHMNYFNRDGSGNALCANGLRCTARYISDNNLSDSDNLIIEAVSNKYECKILDNGQISVAFPPPLRIKTKFKLKVHFVEWWQLLTASYVDVGSPHIVVFIDDIEKPVVKNLSDVKIMEWGQNIRMHKDLMPEGANVNFVYVVSKEKGEIEIRSYERGVERETLACGTGAMSSAIISVALRGLKSPIKVLTKFGSYLTVDFNIVDNKVQNLSLAGGAERI